MSLWLVNKSMALSEAGVWTETLCVFLKVWKLSNNIGNSTIFVLTQVLIFGSLGNLELHFPPHPGSEILTVLPEGLAAVSCVGLPRDTLCRQDQWLFCKLSFWEAAGVNWQLEAAGLCAVHPALKNIFSCRKLAILELLYP